MQILGTFRTKELATAFIWANKSPINLISRSTEVLFALVLSIGLFLLFRLLDISSLFFLHSSLDLAIFSFLKQLLLVLLLTKSV